MSIRLPYRSIHARLAALILLAMSALIVLLVYQQIREQHDQRQRADENLRRLATFAAYAERERFDAAERLLVLAAQGAQFRAVAASPDSPEAYDRCTSTLFVLDQLLPETSGFALWDTSGRTLCSSEAAKKGEFSAAETLWFRTSTATGEFATGGFELSPPDDTPSIGFGLPIRDPATEQIVAFLSTGLKVEQTDSLLAGANLPESGQIGFVDQNGIIISSSSGRSGEAVPNPDVAFAGLDDFGDSIVRDSSLSGRRSAIVRVTDADDSKVTIGIGADKDVLAPPLRDTLPADLAPIVVLTLLTIGAVWLLAQRWIVRPVESLVAASDELAAGKLDARARVPAGVAEFERLGNAFNEMAETRERASHAKDEFLGLVSHELRTPITTVMGNAEILRRRGDALTPDDRRGAIEDIHDGAQRLVAIIDNLLTLARLERGVALESEPLAIGHIARAVAQEQSQRYGNRRVVVEGAESALALGGQTYVEQVLTNLVANALKYSPRGEGINVVLSEDGETVTVRVLDRGPGIDPAEAEAIFEPFYRSPRTAATAEGIGIGLSVCKRLIEAQGGQLWSSPRDGGGCEFGFTLPIAAEEDEAAFEAAPASETPGDEEPKPKAAAAAL